MNREQVKKLFKRIKSHYDKFSTSTEKVDEWCNLLKDYSANGVNNALDEYIKTGYEDAPKCASLMNELYRVNQVERMLDCKYCHERFKEEQLEELYKHEDRCRSVEYIKQHEILVNKTFNKESLLEMSEEKFNEFYDIFLKQIKALNNNGSFNLSISRLYKSM